MAQNREYIGLYGISQLRCDVTPTMRIQYYEFLQVLIKECFMDSD